MIVRFNWKLNLALMERVQRESLVEILDGLQAMDDREIEVTVEQYFPSNFIVKVDSDKLVVFWESEKLAYRVLRGADAFYAQNVKTGAVGIVSKAEVAGPPKGPEKVPMVKMREFLKLVTVEIGQAQACADADDSYAAWGYLLNVAKILDRAIRQF
ncbi:unnamed protein product [marine sediment metagenome]|uniref:Uncharacterized protein n=1 Tax=marine sediment metagenome TaxID=412755 RepID=X1QJ44_9ZZZZ